MRGTAVSEPLYILTHSSAQRRCLWTSGCAMVRDCARFAGIRKGEGSQREPAIEHPLNCSEARVHARPRRVDASRRVRCAQGCERKSGPDGQQCAGVSETRQKASWWTTDHCQSSRCGRVRGPWARRCRRAGRPFNADKTCWRGGQGVAYRGGGAWTLEGGFSTHIIKKPRMIGCRERLAAAGGICQCSTARDQRREGNVRI